MATRNRRPATLKNRQAGENSPATRLVNARIAAGYDTMESAAKAMGSSTSTYSQHECGVRGLKFAAAKYAEAFGITKDWLLYGEAGPPPQRRAVSAQALFAPEYVGHAVHAADPGRVGPHGGVSLWVEHLPTQDTPDIARPFAAEFLDGLGLTVQSAALLLIDASTATAEHGVGDTVLLDTDDDNPDRPGVFVMRASTGQLAVRRLETLIGTEPQEVRVSVGGTDPHAYTVKRKSLIVLGRVRWAGHCVK